MSLTTADWHQRYLQQAHWTQTLRSYLYDKAGLEDSLKVLDVGCGTGVLEHEFADHAPSRLFAMDIDPSALSFARQYAPGTVYTLANGLSIPFANQTFDVTLCHFLLLWVKNVQQVLSEMRRVTRHDGFVLALAEPDYGGRIDYPPELSPIGSYQADALKKQGANPNMGRELRAIFHLAGLMDVEVGVMGGQWIDKPAAGEDLLEWEVIRSDLRLYQEFLIQADDLEALDKDSRHNGKRVLFVPTFYAIGRVQG